MPAIEMLATDVEAAINQGLSQLKLIRAEVKIEVLDEGARGVLGIGARPAKVRLTPYAEVEAKTRAAAMAAMQAPPPPLAPPPPPPPPPQLPSTALAPIAPRPSPAVSTPPSGRETPAAGQSPSGRLSPEESDSAPNTSARRPLAARRPDPRPASGGFRRSEPRSDTPDRGPRRPEPRMRDQESSEPEVAPEGAAELAGEIVRGIVERMGLDVTVEATLVQPRASDDTLSLYVNVMGADAEILLAYQGEALHALQTLTQMMWSHQLKSNLRITVDADGAKAAREQRIMQMAQRMAERVIESGRPVTLEPMPANERRFVHLALRDDDRVYTESQGEGATRKVVIKLKQP